MTMSCNELIEKFEKIGGKLECRYDTQKCRIFPLGSPISNDDDDECKLNPANPNEQYKLDKLLFQLSAGGSEYVTFLPILKNKEQIKLKNKLHYYQNMAYNGFDIKLGEPRFPLKPLLEK